MPTQRPSSARRRRLTGRWHPATARYMVPHDDSADTGGGAVVATVPARRCRGCGGHTARSTERLFVPTGFGSIDDADPIPTPEPGASVRSCRTLRLRWWRSPATPQRSPTTSRPSGRNAPAARRPGAGQVANDQLGTLAASPASRPSAATPVTDEHLTVPAIERGRPASAPGDGAGVARRRVHGAGGKVGILGLFDETVLDKEIATFELPHSTEHRTCISAGASCPFGTPGATGNCSPIVADLAPDTDSPGRGMLTTSTPSTGSLPTASTSAQPDHLALRGRRAPASPPRSSTTRSARASPGSTPPR